MPSETAHKPTEGPPAPADQPVDQPAAVSDLPTGEPIPAPETKAAAAPPPPALSKAPKIPLSTILAATPANIDSFLAHLHRCMTTPAGIDSVLMFVGYTARLSSNLLDSASRTALHRSAHRLIALAFSLPPNTTYLLSAAPQASPVAALAMKLAARLRALSNLLSEGRIFLRSWALLGMYFWGKSLLRSTLETLRKGKRQQQQQQAAAGASDEKGVATTTAAAEEEAATAAELFDKTLALTQFLALVFFQTLENAAFLSSKGILGLSPPQQGKAFRWSGRGFMAYVGLELGRLLIERQRKKDGDVQSEEHREWKAAWQRSMLRYSAWAPLTLHWGFGNGFLHDNAAWAIACIPATLGMRQLWKANA